MLYYLTFMVEYEKLASNLIAPIFKDYSWWINLVMKSIKKSGTFEIRTWADDVEAIESGLRYGEKIHNKSTEEIVFKGVVTHDFEIEVKDNFLSKEGYVKWFTLNLYQDTKPLFSSSHYGNEIVVNYLTKEEILEIQEWAEQYPIIKRVNVFEHIDVCVSN